MFKDDDHGECVDAWLERARTVSTIPSAGAYVDALEGAMGAMWARAQIALGDITLAAIFNRVLFNTGQKFPSFGSLRVQPTGRIDCEALRRGVAHDELIEGARFALVELLTVLGNLTADILTPALHAELGKAPAATGDGNS